MIFFCYPKHKQKTLKFAWQPFGPQSLLWVKINLDPMVRWKGLDFSVLKVGQKYFWNWPMELCS
jgi:hypothetical protein